MLILKRCFKDKLMNYWFKRRKRMVLVVSCLSLSVEMSFVRRVRIVFESVLRLDVTQFEVWLKTMRTFDHELNILLGSLSHIANAKPAHIVLAAARDQHSFKVSETYRTAVLVDLLLNLFKWILWYPFHISLTDCSLDAYLVSESHIHSLWGRLYYFHYLGSHLLSENLF